MAKGARLGIELAVRQPLAHQLGRPAPAPAHLPAHQSHVLHPLGHLPGDDRVAGGALRHRQHQPAPDQGAIPRPEPGGIRLAFQAGQVVQSALPFEASLCGLTYRKAIGRLERARREALTDHGIHVAADPRGWIRVAYWETAPSVKPTARRAMKTACARSMGRGRGLSRRAARCAVDCRSQPRRRRASPRRALQN